MPGGTHVLFLFFSFLFFIGGCLGFLKWTNPHGAQRKSSKFSMPLYGSAASNFQLLRAKRSPNPIELPMGVHTWFNTISFERATFWSQHMVAHAWSMYLQWSYSGVCFHWHGSNPIIEPDPVKENNPLLYIGTWEINKSNLLGHLVLTQTVTLTQCIQFRLKVHVSSALKFRAFVHSASKA